jgi:hypothetical protein
MPKAVAEQLKTELTNLKKNPTHMKAVSNNLCLAEIKEK